MRIEGLDNLIIAGKFDMKRDLGKRYNLPSQLAKINGDLGLRDIKNTIFIKKVQIV